MRAGGPEPAVEAAAQSGAWPELAVWHLQGGQLLAVQVLAFGDDQPEPLALQRAQGGGLVVGDREHSPVHVAWRYRQDLRPEAADQGALVHPDVAHVDRKSTRL